MLKLTTDRHEASRGLFATAELLVAIFTPPPSDTGTVRFSNLSARHLETDF